MTRPTSLPNPAHVSSSPREVSLGDYYHHGSYFDDIDIIADEALHFLSTLSVRSTNDAVVFDLDETCLHTPWRLLDPMKPFDEKAWLSWIHEGVADPIEAIQSVYLQAIELDYKIIFITGRDVSKSSPTHKNLIEVGYHTWEKICYRPLPSAKESTRVTLKKAVHYKTEKREELTKQGYRIVCNIGDQLSDLDGGFSERTYRVPNPFYTIH